MMTDDQADLRLLNLANAKGKFGLQMGVILDRYEQEAFERGIDKDWFNRVRV
jgi:hypothetical protein